MAHWLEDLNAVTGSQGIARPADPHHQILWSFPSCDLVPWLPGSDSSRRKVCSSWEEKEQPCLLLLTLNTMTVWSSSKSDHMPTLRTSGFPFDHWPDRSDSDCCPSRHTQLPLPSPSAEEGLSHCDKTERMYQGDHNIASWVMVSATPGNWWWMTALLGRNVKVTLTQQNRIFQILNNWRSYKCVRGSKTSIVNSAAYRRRRGHIFFFWREMSLSCLVWKWEIYS